MADHEVYPNAPLRLVVAEYRFPHSPTLASLHLHGRRLVGGACNGPRARGLPRPVEPAGSDERGRPFRGAQTHNEGMSQMKFVSEQPGMFILDNLTDPSEVIRLGSACDIRPFGSESVVAGGDGRLEVLAVSSTLERASTAVLAEPAYDRGDDPDWEAAVADDLRVLRRAIYRTKETLSVAENDQVPISGMTRPNSRSLHRRTSTPVPQFSKRGHKGFIKKPTIKLLNRLAMEYGMSWSGIAQSIGVSVQSIHKWRHSGSISIENKWRCQPSGDGAVVRLL